MAVKKGQLEFSPIAGSEQQLSGTLDYQQYPTMSVSKLVLLENGVEKFFLNGDVGKYHWDFDARGKDLEANVIRGLLDLKVPISGPMNMEIHGGGSVADPKISGNFSMRNVVVGVVPIDTAAFSMDLNKGVLSLNGIEAKRKNGFDITGRLSFATDLAPPENAGKLLYDLQLEKGDLRLLKDIFPSIIAAKGFFKARITSSLQDNREKLTGFFHADGIQLRTNSYVALMKCSEINVDLNQNILVLHPAIFKSGEGAVELAGQIEFDKTEPSEFNLTLKSNSERGVFVRIPELTIQQGVLFGKLGLLHNQISGASRGEFFVNLLLKGQATFGGIEINSY